MCEALPHKDIKFVENVPLKTILKTSDDADTGYMVEVDLEYPEELHEKFRQFPPCPETMQPKQEWFSDYQLEVTESTHSKAKTKKLVPHLMKHENYVLHYRNLKFVHELGVKVTVKRVISFTQSKWMSEYINANNRLRTEAKATENEFLVSLFKLMNNSVFGKTMENARNRQNAHLTVDRENAIKWFSKLEFKDATYVDGLYLIQTHKTNVVYDKPVYVGCSILDLSKIWMMDFHYNTMEKHFKGKYDMIYSDTDSMVYHVRHDNFPSWMNNNPREFDLSNMEG